MRASGLVAVVLGAVVVVWEIPFVGSKTSLWPVLMLLAVAVILVGVAQMRHGG